MTTVDLNSDYWNTRYVQNKTGWDIGYANPIHIDYVLNNIGKSARILIPGAGSGYELSKLWEKGFTNVFAIDLSVEAKERFLFQNPSFPENQYLVGDFFELRQKFDLILEQTFFCAIDPQLRNGYVEKTWNILNTNGKLFGVLFSANFEGGPPFGGNIQEYEELFISKFSILKLKNCEESIFPRQGKELIIELIKK
jgi:thiopurine S-methyltransferase